MKRLNRSWIVISVLIVLSVGAYPQDYSGLITEEYLRSEFTFVEKEQMKYAECEKKSYLTCKYIWDVVTPKSQKRDAIKAKNGLTPDGHKVMVIYAKTKTIKDFDHVLATYKDAEELEGIGAKAVWSQQRKQLSLITDNHIIIHVNIKMKPDLNMMQAEMMAKIQGKPLPKKPVDNKTKVHAMHVAEHILKQL